jgi:hypothetical protein
MIDDDDARPAPCELIDKIMALVGDEPMDQSSFALMVCLANILEYMPPECRTQVLFNLAHPDNLYQA